MKLLVATRNKHKLEEIRQLFSVPGLTMLAADEVHGIPADVVEDADTFEGNALKKARELGMASGLWTLADDSGLEVDALNNAPGVYSARFAGEPCSYTANNTKLLRELNGISNRRARFRCVIALHAPDGRAWTVEGRCEGWICEASHGTNGFGYDPLFVPDGYSQTFAELDTITKNSLSHRGHALRKAAVEWKAILSA
jgi:XTP/dITP diphosphohydrolase